MSPDLRRNACPTIARPMETGDGLLARLPPAGPLSTAAFRAVTRAARRFGNGIVEVTARGSLQIRGLPRDSVPAFAAALADAGILDSRPAIHLPPLTGCGPPADGGLPSLADALRTAVAESGLGARLAPKASIVIDGVGPLHLDALDADLRLFVDAEGATIAVGGTAATARVVGRVARGRARDAAIAILERLAALGPGARGRELDPVSLCSEIGAIPAGKSSRPASSEAIGTHALDAETVAVGVGLPFGHVDATTLAALVGVATCKGAALFEPTLGRAVLAIGIRADAAGNFRRHAAALGFIVEAADPRRAVAACAGAPACRSGCMPARAVADAATDAAAAILDGTVTLHVSGCAKGCANPRAATLALVGTDAGLALAVNGRAAEAVPTGCATTDLVAATARLAATIDRERRPGETATASIARLGTPGVASALCAEPAHA